MKRKSLRVLGLLGILVGVLSIFGVGVYVYGADDASATVTASGDTFKVAFVGNSTGTAVAVNATETAWVVEDRLTQRNLYFFLNESLSSTEDPYWYFTDGATLVLYYVQYDSVNGWVLTVDDESCATTGEMFSTSSDALEWTVTGPCGSDGIIVGATPGVADEWYAEVTRAYVVNTMIEFIEALVPLLIVVALLGFLGSLMYSRRNG